MSTRIRSRIWVPVLATTSLIAVTPASAGAQAAQGATAQNLATRPAAETDQVEGVAGGPDDVAGHSGEQVGVGGDIVVTATRQSTLLSKTPITMTVLDTRAVRDAGVTDARDLTKVVPNVAVTGSGQITIRGVTSTDATEKGDPSAAFLIDGIYLSRREDVQGSLFDVGRIEVLRGPQGTLYGRNTTAGVINVISARPSDKFLVSGDMSLGSYDTRSATGVVNVPLTQDIGLRAAVNYRKQNAYWRPLSGNPASLYDAVAGRLSLGGKALDNRLTFVVIGDASHDTGDLPLATSLVATDRFYVNAANGSATLAAGVTPLRIELPPSEQRLLTLPIFATPALYKNFQTWSVRTDSTYDFGPVQLSYLGSYRKSHNRGTDFAFNSGQLYPVVTDQHFSQSSHELRLAFGTGHPLHGQVGGYYFREEVSTVTLRGLPFATTFAANAIYAQYRRFAPTGSDSKAVFGTVIYDITPDLHLTGGLRYTEDHKDRTGTSSAVYATAATVPGGPNCVDLVCLRQSDVQDVRFKRTTWRAGLDWESPFGLIYGSVSSGYKAGGFNDGCVPGTPGAIGCTTPANLLYFNPEKLISYEGGVKFRFGVWRINAAAFHYNYSDLQVSQIIDVPGQQPGSFTSNAAKAKVDGIELSASAQLGANDRFEATSNYLNARYLNFVPDPVRFPAFNFNGAQLSFAPKGTGSLSYTHTVPFADGSHIDLNVRSTISAAYYITDIAGRRLFRQPGFSKSDLNATLTSAGDRFYVGMFVRNLENKITVGGIGAGAATLQEPRIIGGRTGFRF